MNVGYSKIVMICKRSSFYVTDTLPTWHEIILTWPREVSCLWTFLNTWRFLTTRVRCLFVVRCSQRLWLILISNNSFRGFSMSLSIQLAIHPKLCHRNPSAIVYHTVFICHKESCTLQMYGPHIVSWYTSITMACDRKSVDLFEVGRACRPLQRHIFSRQIVSLMVTTDDLLHNLHILTHITFAIDIIIIWCIAISQQWTCHLSLCTKRHIRSVEIRRSSFSLYII